MDIREKIRNAYSFIWNNYEKFLVIPIILLSISAFALISNYTSRGEFISKGIDFTGGTEIKIHLGENSAPKNEYTSALSQKIDVVNIRTMKSLQSDERWVEFQTKEIVNESQIKSFLEERNLPYDNESKTWSSSPTVASTFLEDARIAVIAAFIIMSIVIFVAFRSVVPSLAVILAAIVDIVISLGAMSIIGIELSLGSLAALLMLLGYSVDTDILLSTRIIRRTSGSLSERNLGAMKTGLTYSIASLTAFFVLFLVSNFLASSEVLTSISLVLMIGLLADIPATWFQNSVILKNYIEVKK